MHPIIYDVAVSIDGYISVPDGEVSGFAHEGAVVDDCHARLRSREKRRGGLVPHHPRAD